MNSDISQNLVIGSLLGAVDTKAPIYGCVDMSVHVCVYVCLCVCVYAEFDWQGLHALKY